MPDTLEDLSRADVTWEGGIVPLSEVAEDLPAHAADDHVVLWWEVETDEAVEMLAYERDELPAAAAALVLKAMRRPMDLRPRRPRMLRVADRALARMVWETVAHLGIRLLTEPLSSGWLAYAMATSSLLVPKVPVRSCLNVPGVGPELAARFFRAAAAYERLDRRVLLQGETVILEMESHPEPLYAWQIDPGLYDMEGIAIYASQRAFAQRYQNALGPPVPPGGDAIAVVFEPEEAVAPSLRREQRQHGWEVSSESFPVAYRRGQRRVRETTAAELRLLSTALEALTSSLRRRQVELERRSPLRDEVEVGDAEHRVAVRVHYPRRAPAPIEAWLVAGAEERFVAWGRAEARPLRAFREAVAALPHAHSTLRRLSWSFFRDARPSYALELDDMLEEERANRRFIDWAVFMTHRLPGVPTLAVEAILAGLVPGDQATARRIARPRYSVFQVEGVRRDGRAWLRDKRSGVRLRIRPAPWLAELRVGALLVGPIFTHFGRDHAPGALALIDSPVAERLAELLQRGTGDVAPMIEMHLFGATTQWIREATTRDFLEAAYEDFREALGSTLPSRQELAARPGPSARTNGGPPGAEAYDTVGWWTSEEREIYRTFALRLSGTAAQG